MFDKILTEEYLKKTLTTPGIKESIKTLLIQTNPDKDLKENVYNRALNRFIPEVGKKSQVGASPNNIVSIIKHCIVRHGVHVCLGVRDALLEGAVGVRPVLLQRVVLRRQQVVHRGPQPLGPGPGAWRKIFDRYMKNI